MIYVYLILEKKLLIQKMGDTMTKKYFLLLLLFAIPACKSKRGPVLAPCATDSCSAEPVCEVEATECETCPTSVQEEEVNRDLEYVEDDSDEDDSEEFEFDLDDEDEDEDSVDSDDSDMEQAVAEAIAEIAVEEELAEEPLDDLDEDVTEKVALGCEPELKPIYYAYNSKTLSSDQEDILKENLKVAQKLVSEGYDIVVRGHSDSICRNADYNEKVSEQRAKEVASYLEKHGINAKIEACGSKNPIIACGDKSEQSLNRRAEILALANH